MIISSKDEKRKNKTTHYKNALFELPRPFSLIKYMGVIHILVDTGLFPLNIPSRFFGISECCCQRRSAAWAYASATSAEKPP
jgi:hypothetical protein